MNQAAVARNRQPELDVIRIFALCGVVWLHCLLYIGFYTQSSASPAFLPALFIRTVLSVTVPLFIMLTGYLLCEKPLPAHPLKGLEKILLIYILACIPTYFFRQVEEANYQLSLPGFLWTILDYTLNHYSWYISMYLGLFLLAPYLNILHRALDQKGNRRLLLLLFVLISLPTLTNTLQLFNLEFWQHPSTVNGGFNKLLPEFWQDLPYPLFYYGLGAYIKHNPPRIRLRTLLGLFLGSSLLFSAYNLWRLDGRPFFVNSWVNLFGFEAATLTPIVFLLLQHLFAGRIQNQRTIQFLSGISRLTLGACLLSYCSDMILYRILHLSDRFSSFREALLFSPLLVLASTGMALLMSIPLTALAQALTKRLSGKVKRQ